MTYEQLKLLKPSAFKRKCGVQLETCSQMVEVLHPHLNRTGFTPATKRCVKCRRPIAFSALYWREERTEFHIGTSWGISESAVCRLIAEIETLLSQSGKFRLPGNKQVAQNADTWSVVVVDVTASPIERPKKPSELTTVAKNSGLRVEGASCCQSSRWTAHLHSL